MLAYRWISIRQDVASMKIIPESAGPGVQGRERWEAMWDTRRVINRVRSGRGSKVRHRPYFPGATAVARTLGLGAFLAVDEGRARA